MKFCLLLLRDLFLLPLVQSHQDQLSVASCQLPVLHLKNFPQKHNAFDVRTSRTAGLDLKDVKILPHREHCSAVVDENVT